eukprot:COSAG01_NODE_8553_length_2744_cov_4.364461_2_plen_46_part_00
MCWGHREHISMDPHTSRRRGRRAEKGRRRGVGEFGGGEKRWGRGG